MNIKVISIAILVVAVAVAAAIGIIAQVRSTASANTRGTAPVANTARKPEPLKAAVLPVYRNKEYDGERVVKTKAQWRKQLTRRQYHILREEGTEAPYSHGYTNNHEEGVYHCAACDLALFKSANKYNSDTGWPSFYQPIFPKNVVEVADTKLAEKRIEIECARCGSHLGHVFDDGPQPTGLRYCINGLSLKFRKT